MSLWFSASAVVPQLTAEWSLNDSQAAWMTMSVQLGFVVGALLSAVLNLSDRFQARYLFALSAVAAAGFNAGIAWLDLGAGAALGLRALTGLSLAGVYPPAMKLVASWCKEDRGLGIGILIGALTLGSALPHLLNALQIFGEGGMPPWRHVLLATSGGSIFAAVIVGLFFRSGPHVAEIAPFHWRFVIETFRYRPTRLANFGYLGHMWELYAMWTWTPIFLMESYRSAGRSVEAARLAGFGAIAAGAAGCVVAGVFADRIGRTTVTMASLAVSGACALTVGLFFGDPDLLTAICLLWGFSVVADSAQFSAAVSELTDPRYVGTALTVQTSAGFLITLVTIQLIPVLADTVGWEGAFPVLALGPIFGILSMWRLRRLPESTGMASGHR
ncbi:MAG: MFS transporter [Planctomycetota bacterium]|nr:MFS transporter [Planctomycetota bacterium]